MKGQSHRRIQDKDKQVRLELGGQHLSWEKREKEEMKHIELGPINRGCLNPTTELLRKIKNNVVCSNLGDAGAEGP